MSQYFLSSGLLVFGAGFLCLPSHRFFATNTVWWSFSRILQNDRVTWRAGWHAHHAFDLIRAWAGMWLVKAGLMLLTYPSEVMALRVEYATLALLGTIGSLFQLGCLERDNGMQAPVAYTAGIVLAMFSPAEAVPAILFGLASAFAFRALPVYFLAMAALLAGFGVAFGSSKLLIAGGLMVTGTPVVASFFTRRKFVIRLPQRALRERRARSRVGPSSVERS